MIKKIAVGMLIFVMSMTLISCGYKENSDSEAEKITFSENILFTINNGAAGFGTVYDCLDADITVYCDGTIHVEMISDDGSGVIKDIAVLELTEKDYEALTKIVDREKIYNMNVKEDRDVCDGSSSHIILYDENDKVLVTKGGYMAGGDGYDEVYTEIKDVLHPYGIHAIVEDYRKHLDEIGLEI